MGVQDSRCSQFVYVFRFAYLPHKEIFQVLKPETLVTGSKAVTSRCLVNYINLSVLNNSSLQAAYFYASEVTLFCLLRKRDS